MAKPIEEKGHICINEEVGPGLFIMEVGAPAIAQMVAPGQFVHARVPAMEAHLLRRPFSIYSAVPELGIVEILYQVVGHVSEGMTHLVLGDKIDFIGPIGTGWNPPADAKSALLVGGGVGAAPLFMLADSLLAKGVEVDVVLGAQSKHGLVCRERYTDLLQEHVVEPDALRCATDDGSFGYAGFCTPLVEEALNSKEYDYLAVCGPEPLMRLVSTLAQKAHVACEISLERRMACGIGACLSCVVETTEGMKRACVDGPIFNAQKVVFS